MQEKKETKFRVTLTERDLNDLVSGQERDRVIEKIYRAYHKGRRQKYMAKRDKNPFYLQYATGFNPTVLKLKGR